MGSCVNNANVDEDAICKCYNDYSNCLASIDCTGPLKDGATMANKALCDALADTQFEGCCDGTGSLDDVRTCDGSVVGAACDKTSRNTRLQCESEDGKKTCQCSTSFLERASSVLCGDVDSDDEEIGKAVQILSYAVGARVSTDKSDAACDTLRDYLRCRGEIMRADCYKESPVCVDSDEDDDDTTVTERKPTDLALGLEKIGCNACKATVTVPDARPAGAATTALSSSLLIGLVALMWC